MMVNILCLDGEYTMFVVCDENNCFHCTIGSVMHLFNKCTYI